MPDRTNSHMNSLAVCALLLTCSALSLLESCAETPPASVEWAGHTFREIRTLSALPPSLQTALGRPSWSRGNCGSRWEVQSNGCCGLQAADAALAGRDRRAVVE